ncbi:uncharacterized protein LAESUDRAFT_815982 [Laetiporus sulphureus 93-53]|uniref:DH domain-containing protein n=1 Tax=Laetiporus sulphureus 93-53 TaxID=1314785 RepID=A0A165BLQ3_9APHY|nr:uncharacterized protein LAESUDRAFT_815982 [Laetiporus sulphureus 93-53]KZT01281.1 hypothetical protein LAESUDRAFT_815982 [Laetiporus sulphureus 93-53]
MPLARSRFRSKSRSPAPNVSSSPAFTISASRTPAFLPPSHYAAAAGLQYPSPRPPGPVSSTPERAGSSLLQTISPCVLTSPAPPSRTEFPASEGNQSAPVAPGSHLNRMSRLISRSPGRPMSRSFGRSTPKSGQREQEKGQNTDMPSPLVDIPLVEMQLIPTLRDTVDRMTHPPPPSNRFEEGLDDLHGSRSTMASRTPVDSFGAFDPSHEIDSYRMRQTVEDYRSPSQASRPRTQASSVVTAIAGPLRTERAQYPRESRRTHSPPKTSSALSATPFKRSLLPTVVESSDNAARSPGQSLRKARPWNSPSNPINVPDSHDSPALNQTRGRGRSGPQNLVESEARTAPSTQSKSLLPRPNGESIAKPNLVAPLLSSGTPRSKIPHGTPKLVVATQSPLRARSNIPRPSHTSASASDSTSDIEKTISYVPRPSVPHRSQGLHEIFDNENDDRGRRRMHQPYGTGSRGRAASTALRDLGRQSVAMQLRDRYNRTQAATQQMPVGLGFHLHPNEEENPYGTETDESDEHSVYDEPDDQESRGSDSAIDSPAEEEALADQYKTVPSAFDTIRGSFSEHREETEKTRQREALMGIVHNLHVDYESYPANGRRSVLSQSDSGAYHEQGIAITVSQELHPDGVDDAGHSLLPIVEERYSRTSSRYDDESVYSAEGDEESLNEVEGECSSQQASTNLWARESLAGPLPSSSGRNRGDRSSIRHEEATEASVKRISRVASPLPAPVVSSERQRRRSQPFDHNIEVPYTASSDARRRTQTDMRQTPKLSPRTESSPRRTSKRYIEPDRTPQVAAGKFSHQSDDSSDLSVLDSYAGQNAADREREGFGIPRSLSYGAGSSEEAEETTDSRGSVSRSASDDSMAGSRPRMSRYFSGTSEIWQEQNGRDALSQGAHTLFEVLADGSAGSSVQPGAHSSRIRQCEDYDTIRRRQSRSEPQQAHSSRVEREPSPRAKAEPSIKASWRSMLNLSTFNALLSRYGPMEVQRQEVIYKLFIEEKAFVKHSRAVVASFILPLRSHDTKSWLPGVPADISRLFDWYEDIVNLHAGVARVLKSATRPWQTGGVVDAFAAHLLAIAPKLEVYQPYIARIDEVKELLATRIDDPQDEFGEYVRMRQQEEAWSGHTLEDLLQEPVNRLGTYPETFERLLDVTPKHHVDHLPTVFLLSSIRTMIEVLEEVRIREEEYDFVKDIFSRIVGIPQSARLAKRERRLLHHGVLHRIPSNEKPHAYREPSPPVTPTLQINGKPIDGGRRKPGRPRDDPQRMSRLASAIHDWHVRRARPGSISSSASSSLSLWSRSTAESSKATPLTPASDAFGRPREDVVPLQALVFDDLVVFMTPAHAGTGGAVQDGECEDQWALLEEVGLARVLYVTEREEDANSCNVILDLLPLNSDQAGTGSVPQAVPVVELTVSIPTVHEDPESFQYWLAALHQSQEHTTHALSFAGFSYASSSGGSSGLDINSDLHQDTFQAMKSIVSCGMPLPKSPSMQFQEKRDEVGQEREREERAWWSLRFQQVIRDVQRQRRAGMSFARAS